MRSAIFLLPAERASCAGLSGTHTSHAGICHAPAGTATREVMNVLLARGVDVYCVHEDVPDAKSSAIPPADMLVLDATARPDGDGEAISGIDSIDAFAARYEIATIRPLKLLTSALPLLAGDGEKRVCVLVSPPGGYQNDMRLAALYMALKLLFNALRPRGYTFRLLRDGPAGAGFAANYFLKPRAGGDEDRLVLRDCEGAEIPY